MIYWTIPLHATAAVIEILVFRSKILKHLAPPRVLSQLERSPRMRKGTIPSPVSLTTGGESSTA